MPDPAPERATAPRGWPRRALRLFRGGGMLAVLASLLSFGIGVGGTTVYYWLNSDYPVEEALISPDGTYQAVRFMEMGRFFYCNEVVIVIPNNMAFTPGYARRYVPYTVFEAACSTRARIGWTGRRRLLVAYDGQDDTRKLTSEDFRKTDKSGKVAITFRNRL